MNIEKYCQYCHNEIMQDCGTMYAGKKWCECPVELRICNKCLQMTNHKKVLKTHGYYWLCQKCKRFDGDKFTVYK